MTAEKSIARASAQIDRPASGADGAEIEAIPLDGDQRR